MRHGEMAFASISTSTAGREEKGAGGGSGGGYTLCPPAPIQIKPPVTV